MDNPVSGIIMETQTEKVPHEVEANGSRKFTDEY